MIGAHAIAVRLVTSAVTVALAVCRVAPARSEITSIPPPEEGSPIGGVTGSLAPVEIDPVPYAAPLPTSLLVEKERVVVRRGPTKKAKRRGVVMAATRLPVYQATEGPGCAERWYKVHEDAWVCGSDVSISEDDPWGLRYPVVPDGKLTPWPYAFVRQPAIEYRGSGGALSEVREVFKGYGFGVKRVTRVGGQLYFRTVEDRLVPKHAAGITHRISEFGGVTLAEGDHWPVGWVNASKAYAYDAPSLDKQHRIAPVERYTLFDVLEVAGQGRRGFVRFDDDAWLARKDVRIARTAEIPAAVGPDDKWVDVDLAEQVITAYEGSRPVFATLISSGRGGGSSTRRGQFRIWVKVSAIPMDNTDEELEEEEVPDGGVADERHLYSLHDVPWTQFFFENFALHGVYWHDRFGNRRSHGCVNLAPRDARWFFDWTEPHLPDGWWAIYSHGDDRGTLIRVR